MMGLGVGDISLTMHTLFPVSLDTEMYLKNSIMSLNIIQIYNLFDNY